MLNWIIVRSQIQTRDFLIFWDKFKIYRKQKFQTKK